MDEFLENREANFVAGIAKMYRAYNRAGSPITFTKKAEDFDKLLPSLKSDQIIKFFTYVTMTDDVLPTDKRVKGLYHNWHPASECELSNYGYYDLNGYWIQNGTYDTITAKGFKHVIYQLSASEIELLVMADNGLLEPTNEEVERLLNKKYWVSRGKYQVSFEKWGDKENEEFEKVMSLKAKKVKYMETLQEKYSKQGILI